ncbi:HlyC/CorC family transporter [Cytobacillus oceanisediminis]|uniref:HlyC/CorC family transporter n=1 Tax=Niallia alba TaxID=2729105 RepID=A0A7Y0K4X2_9BACI|nr:MULTISPECIES: hemolysin family protein [Bacillaceae]MDU1844599.1 hemolysin family protein [Niallia nealsonii]MBZ9534956.1 HlyC/CorC family transporter [Cytobacillus oceanisediminis]MED3795036.1 hemolysin family protein [Niallia alba]NMO75854.1 HlyC/CorC family transporter [Niallia alba]UTI43651.1 hemolysin family protein [Niallia sp. RD1]
MEIFNLILFVILIALTAFFVATEFAIVKVRSSRIDQLVAEGKKGALAAKKVTTHLDEYLSACQLGITVTALGLGWIGESTFAEILEPLFVRLSIGNALSHLIAFIISFLLVTFLHVVVGELAPKTVAIQKAELISLTFATPIIWFYRLLYPFIWLLNGSARLLTSIFGLKPASEHELAHSEEELRILMSESYKSGEINKNELAYVNNIFEFDERIAKEIMVPRTEMVTISVDNTFDEIMAILEEENYTRYPLVNGDKDNVIGLINIREFLTATIQNKQEIQLEEYMKPIIRVIETVPIRELLIKMQKERTHMAILLDEYGGTSGIVTAEDILEEIVGDIRDEFDEDEISDIRKIKDNHYILNGKVLISEVNDLLGTHLSEDEVDTIGGWFLTNNFEAVEGDILEEEGYIFKIKNIEEHHIHFIEVMKDVSVVEVQ